MAEIQVTKLFDEHEIAIRVEELARMVAERLPDNFVIVGLLVGSFVFVADFIRALYRISCNPTVEFIRLSSYGLGRQSSGNPRLIGETGLDLAGRTVLLVDDIVDRGAHGSLRARIASREESSEDLHLCTCGQAEPP